jgi:hypothetical protein
LPENELEKRSGGLRWNTCFKDTIEHRKRFDETFKPGVEAGHQTTARD